MEVKKVTVGEYGVYTADQLDGYGFKHLDDIVSAILFLTKQRGGKNVLEWCSGPGYIGFGLLHINKADRMTFSDIHPPAGDFVNRTIKENGLEDRAEFIVSDNFANLDDKYDLIVGNPPHFNFKLEETHDALFYEEHRKHMDMNWEVHRNFFENVSDYLTDDGQIVLMENMKGSSITTFYDMIYSNGLRVDHYITSPNWPEDIWYLKVVKK